MLRRSDRTIVALIFLVALAVRLVGIKHGFPYIFHPDEPTIIRSALAVRFFPNPGHFDWPHLYIYVNYLMFMGFAYLRDFLVSANLKELASSYFPLMWNDDVIFYYLARVLTAVISAATVIPVYLTGKKLFRSRVGILAAFTFALLPFDVQHSHYALPDIPMAFFVAWGMYFAAKIVSSNEPSYYASSGFYIGLAASSKYNGGLSAVMVPVAHLIRIIKSKTEELIDFTGITNLVIAGLMALVGFLVGTPYAAIDLRTFLRDDSPQGAMWQFTNVGSVSWAQRLPKFYNDMVFKVADDLGYVVLLGFFIMVGIVLVKTVMNRMNDRIFHLWFLIAPSLFLLFYVSGFETSRSHYYFPAYPFLVVVFGYLASEVFYLLASKFRFLAMIGLFLLFVIPAYMTFQVSYRYHKGDTRNVLDMWLKENASDTATIVYEDTDLEPVIKDKSYTVLKGYDRIPTLTSGYLVVSYDDYLDTESDDYTDYLEKLTKVKSIDANGYLGPNLEIYAIGNGSL